MVAVIRSAIPRLGAILALGAAVPCWLASGAVAQAPGAEPFPARPIRMIVPFPPGGSNDILGRFIAQRMSERMGRQTVVDNRPGADGMIGTEAASRAPADGYTILIVSTSYTMNPAIHKTKYDPATSLIPIARIATGANVICVNPSYQAGTVAELIALAKAKPGELRYATSGIGGFNHFGGELFKQLAKVEMLHIPYKGGAPSMIDVMSGQVELVFSTLIQAMPHIRSGKLKALGVGSDKRSPLLPNLPAIAETVPGYDGSVWWGLLAPAGLPGPIITRLNSEVNAILAEPEMAQRLAAEAATPAPGTPDDFGKLIVSDLAKWARIAKEAGIRAE